MERRKQDANNILMMVLLLLVFLSNQISGAFAFDTSSYAFANPCIWSACEDLPGEQANYNVSCCVLDVPLNYAKPNENNISISMIRFSPLNVNSNSSLFILSGGPGEAGLGTLLLLLPLIPAEYGITLMTPDHRGTGYSTLLSCDDEKSQVVTMDCINYLTNRWTVEGLNQFTTTAAAHDLAIQIQAAQVTGHISILGISYGTYWLNRFLTIYPNLVQTAIMDSPIHPLQHAFSIYNIRASSIGLQFLTYCFNQTECIQHFVNTSPAIMLDKISQEIYFNKQLCINRNFRKYNITSEKLKATLFSLFRSPSSDGTVVPAIIFRLNRCNEDDISTLNFFFQTQYSPPQPSSSPPSNEASGPVMFSYALHYNIAFSELWFYLNQADVDQQTLNASQNVAIIIPELESNYVALRNAWPKYSIDEYRYSLASSPIMMINGELDSATPLKFAADLASITSNTRTLYAIPLSGHVISIFANTMAEMCPFRLMLSWAFPSLFPTEWRNPVCIKNLPTTIDFVGFTKRTRASSMKFLNTSRPFGNEDVSQGANLVSAEYSIPLLIFLYFFNAHVHGLVL